MRGALIWIMFSVLLRALAEAFSKQAGIESSGIFQILLSPWYMLALSMAVLQALAWTIALKKSSLSFAYPFMSLTIAFGLITSFFVFNETVGIYEIFGAVIILFGVSILAYGEHAS